MEEGRERRNQGGKEETEGGDGAVVGKVRDEETESGEMKIRRKCLE